MVATKIRLLDEAKPEAAEAAAIEAELAAKGLDASNTTLADCLAATSDLDLGGKWGGTRTGSKSTPSPTAQTRRSWIAF